MANSNIDQINPQIFSSIKFEDVRLGKIFKYGDGHYMINIYNSLNQTEISALEKDKRRQETTEEHSKLIIQTPLLYIPNGIVYHSMNSTEKPNLHMVMQNYENDDLIGKFEEWLNELENHIFELIKLKRVLGINNTSHQKNSIIKSKSNKNNNQNSNNLYTPINKTVSKCIISLIGKHDKILFDWNIPTPTYGVSLIWVKNIWIKGNKWGINLFTYACKVMDSHILEPRYIMDNFNLDNKNVRAEDINSYFTGNSLPNTSNINDINTMGKHEEYGKYYKMLKMGVPREAVKHKLQSVGINTDIIDFPDYAPITTVLHLLSQGKTANDFNKYYKSGNKSDNKSGNINNNDIVSGGIGAGIPPPPPPPPSLDGNINSINNISGGNARSALFSSIASGNFKLKKMDPNDIRSGSNSVGNSNNSNKKNNPNELKVPSLSEITGALAKLRKVVIE